MASACAIRLSAVPWSTFPCTRRVRLGEKLLEELMLLDAPAMSCSLLSAGMMAVPCGRKATSPPSSLMRVQPPSKLSVPSAFPGMDVTPTLTDALLALAAAEAMRLKAATMAFAPLSAAAVIRLHAVSASIAIVA